MNKILGLHHVTAIASDAKRNHEFYTNVLGLRLVKKTVNFDDPQTYHLYYGDEIGNAGTILTFFPWSGIRQGHTGTGMATSIGYSAPNESLDFWMERFKEFKVIHENVNERFGEKYLSLKDPDGLNIDLIVSQNKDDRKPWQTLQINSSVALRGFKNVTLTLKNITATVAVLTGILGYKLYKQQGNRYRFITDAVDTANTIDIIELPNGSPGDGAAGTNHHVAFRVKDDNILM